MLSVSAIRFEERFFTSKIGGIGGGERVSVQGAVHNALFTWQLPCLAVEKPWSALAGPFLSFLTQTGVNKALLPF